MLLLLLLLLQASCVSRWDRNVHFQRTHSPHRISERSKAAQVRSRT